MSRIKNFSFDFIVYDEICKEIYRKKKEKDIDNHYIGCDVY